GRRCARRRARPGASRCPGAGSTPHRHRPVPRAGLGNGARGLPAQRPAEARRSRGGARRERRPVVTALLDATVVIATYNRARFLDETLSSIRELCVASGRTWEVIVVDNNSSDDTRAVVERHAGDFPVALRYLFESRQG